MNPYEQAKELYLATFPEKTLLGWRFFLIDTAAYPTGYVIFTQKIAVVAWYHAAEKSLMVSLALGDRPTMLQALRENIPEDAEHIVFERLGKRVRSYPIHRLARKFARPPFVGTPPAI